MKPLITIFTPLYNRAHFLERIFFCLNEQNVVNFEWLVINDGSTDNAEGILFDLQCWKKNFEVSFYTQKNGGKHRAINSAVQKARGEYMLILDSDDLLVQGATEFIERWINEIRMLDDYDKFVGVSGFRITPNGKIISGTGTKNYFVDASNLERHKYKILGDCAEVYKIEILKKYPFPEFEGENFLSEDVVWNSIAFDGYKFRWYKEPIMICEYLSDGLTMNLKKKLIESFKGFTYTTQQILNVGTLEDKILAINNYKRIAKRKGMKFKGIYKNLDVDFIFFVCGLTIFQPYYFAKLFFGKVKGIIGK